LEVLNVAAGQELNTLTARIPSWNGWLATYVTNENGAYVGADGSSESLSNQVDLQLLISLRSKTKVIVTTGATARAENYKSSRFAPIAFLTRNASSLAEIPAFKNPGANGNLIFSSDGDEELFTKFDSDLRSMGLGRILFEGGPAHLAAMVSQLGAIQLVLCIANLSQPDAIKPEAVLAKLSPETPKAVLLDDFVIGANRITRWLIER
jgi:hypothetical protein